MELPRAWLGSVRTVHDLSHLLVNVPTDDASAGAFIDLASDTRRRGIDLFAVSGHPGWHCSRPA